MKDEKMLVVAAHIGDYLWRYRESGQYAAINAAARQLDTRG